ncbi:MAG: site-specific DNA-methyltransferase, partial [Candidatus Hydrogenedens sp.]|nr:site-specific DNA-methyltransferase [Candidatus Hydrogenedens sp.]
MNKLNKHTQNQVDINIRRIGELFPNALTERKNEKGEVERAIDFDVLRQELSQVLVEGPQ